MGILQNDCDVTKGVLLLWNNCDVTEGILLLRNNSDATKGQTEDSALLFLTSGRGFTN